MPELSREMRPRLVSYARVQWDATRERHVLLIPEGVLMLNDTGVAILKLCDGQRTIATIAAELSAQYQQSVEQDVIEYLQRLVDKRLIELHHD